MGSSKRPVIYFTAAPEVRGGEVSASAIKLEAWGRHSVLVELKEGRDSVRLLIWEPVHKGEQRSRDSRLEFAVVPMAGNSVRVRLRPRATSDRIQDQAPGGGAHSAPPLDERVPLRVRLVDPTGEAVETSARRFTIAGLAQGTAELLVGHDASQATPIDLALTYYGPLPVPGPAVPTLTLWMLPMGSNGVIFEFRPALASRSSDGG